MPCKEAQLRICQRQTEGLMFHDQMTDYYAFLHLGVLKKMHKEQTKEELHALREAKCNFIDAFGMLPMYPVTDPHIIPSDWQYKTNSDMTENDLKILIRKSLNTYLEWEKDTLEIYKREAAVFKEYMHYPLYREACEMIEEVQEEIAKVSDLIIDAASCDYCPSYFKKL